MSTITNLKCPRCGAPMHKATAWSGGESEFWYVCDRAPACNTYFNAFKPMPHQYQFLADNHKFKLNAGGYGSAKTYATRQFIYKQLFMNPGGQVLVGANVSSQYEQTIKKELEADIPKAFVKTYSTQKAYMELFNGARLLYRPYDDEGKIRSMNLSAWVIMEGSEVDKDIYVQLKSRLRNMHAANFKGINHDTGLPVYENFRGQGIVESNPENGWLRTEFLDPADEIYQHGTATVKYEAKPEKRDPSISVHISSTDANKFLPDTYITDLAKNKPQWWVDRYLFGSFEFANGLVYPDWRDCVIPAFEPDKKWVRILAHDPGIVDASAWVLAAIDDREGIVYIYRDLQYHDLSVDELYERYCREIAWDLKPTQLYTQPILDPKFYGRRNITDKQTYDDMWAQKGVYFQPGHVNVDDRVFRVQNYIKSGRLKIMNNCSNLLRELPEYKWQVQKDGMYKQKPIDKNNHSIDAMSWITMKLPEDPRDLMFGAYTGFGAQLAEKDYRTPEEKLAQLCFTSNEPEFELEENWWT